MRPYAPFALALVLAISALADTPKPAQTAQTAQTPRQTPAERQALRVRMSDIRGRASALEPRRRDTPMRELNITDFEVREIQDVASRYLVRSMLNISPVVSGCACEEGPMCTDQVYVIATTPTETKGLQLSRIRNAWIIGPVQKWWFQYYTLKAKRSRMDFFEYEDAENRLLLEFPFCATDDKKSAATAQTIDEKK